MPVLSESHICGVSKEIEGGSNTDGGEPEEYPPKKLVTRLDMREEGGLEQGKGMALSQTQVARTRMVKRTARSPIARSKSQYKPIHHRS